ncbi:MAG: transposase, partial [Planctomycetaceae bacterium]|jgi:transposase|nr:transposase [Planctomycetaceae bacterium]
MFKKQKNVLSAVAIFAVAILAFTSTINIFAKEMVQLKEGLNNKIKTMKRQAYGFRDLEFFKLKILAIHNARYELVG